MKVRPRTLSILPPLMVLAAAQAAPAPPVRIATSFDRDWRFLKADAPGAETPAFDDANWRTLDIPHDWSIEGPFDRKNPTGGAGVFLPAGVGWYRKHFTLPADYARRRVFIEFDGVMAKMRPNAGSGVMAAVDSADTTSHEAFQGSQRRAFQGWRLAILKATAASSKFTVTASSAGLAGASLVIETGASGTDDRFSSSVGRL